MEDFAVSQTRAFCRRRSSFLIGGSSFAVFDTASASAKPQEDQVAATGVQHPGPDPRREPSVVLAVIKFCFLFHVKGQLPHQKKWLAMTESLYPMKMPNGARHVRRGADGSERLPERPPAGWKEVRAAFLCGVIAFRICLKERTQR